MTEDTPITPQPLAEAVSPLHGFWDRPAPSDRGDADPRTLYEAVGFSLTNWEMVESSIAMLFCTFAHTDALTAMRVFGTLGSNRSKADALKAAAEVFFTMKDIPQDVQGQFNLLVKHYSSASTRRNDIAHGIASAVATDGNVERGIFLVPPSHATSKVIFPFKALRNQSSTYSAFGWAYQFTSADIFAFAQKFKLLERWLFGYFVHALRPYRPQG